MDLAEMAASTSLTIPLEPELDARLERLAQRTHRTRASLAAEAIAVHVARETEIIDAIHRGLVDMKGGRLIPHDAAMAEVDAAIDETA